MANHDGVSLEEFERFALFYTRRFLDQSRRHCPDLETDPFDSLKFFLMGYAFERQGRSPDYSPAARDTAEKLKKYPLTRGSETQAWDIFRSNLPRGKLNYANNPMCPRQTSFQRKGVNRSTAGISAVEFIRDELGGQCIVPWARDRMISGNTQEAHERLKKINGVNKKIASFFLRDVAVIYELAPSQGRELLQPLDTWVRFAARELAKDTNLSEDDCARFIVEHSCQPEAANQGIWYFCVQVANSSKYEVGLCLKDRDYMQDRLQRHLAGLVSLVSLIRT
jgi:hypothetical protein